MPKLSKPVKAMVTANMRRLILEKSEELITRDGLDNLTMEKLAREAEISAGSIYNYFHNKDEIVNGIMEHTFLRLLENVREIAAGKALAADKIFRLALFMFEDFPRVRRLHEALMHRHPPLDRQKFRDGHRQLLDAVGTIVTQGVEAGQFRRIAPELAASALLGMIREIQFDPAALFASHSPRQSAEAVTGMILQGLRCGGTEK